MLLTSLNLNPLKISACTYVCAAIFLRLPACLLDVRAGEIILCYRILSFNHQKNENSKYFNTPPTKDRNDPSRRPGCYRRLWRRSSTFN